MERDAENKYGKRFYATLSKDLENELDANGFSVTNLKYSKYFFCLYSDALRSYGNSVENRPQLVDSLANEIRPQPVEQITEPNGFAITPQVGEQSDYHLIIADDSPFQGRQT